MPAAAMAASATTPSTNQSSSAHFEIHRGAGRAEIANLAGDCLTRTAVEHTFYI
jgi:hypothetical protein